ncbi:glutaredoxin family protein [Rothia sp. AR01]|uniref:Glutaredoxin family protein n=1 Tax=Rothia santali TaxID=2949643 RepID=A0A9X2KGN8_9MICC|nr:glutaredoxin family protein [Rothia santali]MCP3425032.1 glutaredoxin family protein [Rothia santali]
MSHTAPTIELLTSPGCHLCEAARADLDQVVEPLGLTWTEVDVTLDPELLRRFAEEIPVVMIEGVPRDFWRVDRPRITRILTGLLEGRDPEA